MPYKKPKYIKFIELGRLLRGYGLNCVKLANVLDCCPATAIKKLSNPETLTLRDIDRIVRFGHVPKEEVLGNIKIK